METFGTVVGADVKVVAHGGHFFLVDEEIGGLGADDDIDLGAVLVQPLGLGIDRSGADTAGDEDKVTLRQFFGAHRDEFGRVAERAHDIGEGLAGLEGHDVLRRGANRLRNDGHGAFLDIEITDSQRNTLSFFISPDNQELAGLGGGRQPRCFHDHPTDGRRQHFLLSNLVHRFLCSSFLIGQSYKKKSYI